MTLFSRKKTNVNATKTKFGRFFSDHHLPTPSTGPETDGQARPPVRRRRDGPADHGERGGRARVYTRRQYVGGRRRTARPGRLERASACVDRVTCCDARVCAYVCVCVGVREYRSVRRRRRRRRRRRWRRRRADEDERDAVSPTDANGNAVVDRRDDDERHRGRVMLNVYRCLRPAFFPRRFSRRAVRVYYYI